VGHRNARLTLHGRRLLVRRVRVEGMPIAHAAKAMGVSRQCAHRWVARYDADGDAGLLERSSRPKTTPTKTPAKLERKVLQARAKHRLGPDRLAEEVGVPARTIGRILRRHDVPRLAECDPMTGEAIRSSKATTVRYERDRPGELVHMDVKKIGRIPAGGGWRAHGRQMGSTAAKKKARIGFDYVHSVVDDHTRIAYSEILADEKADTCAAFFERAVSFYAGLGVSVDAVMTDNHWSYTRSSRLAAFLGARRIDHILIKAHCPWQNGKVERFNRTLQMEWVYRRVFTTNDARARALQPWLTHYNNTRRHHALGGRTPLSRLSPT
jgi:transposase InsO family protein